MDPNLLQAVMSNPELLQLIQRPGVMQKLQEIMGDPAKARLYMDDPEIQTIMQKLGGSMTQTPPLISKQEYQLGKLNVIDSANQYSSILNNPEGRLVVVDYFATWCGPCKAMTPRLESMASAYPSAIFIKVDCDKFKPIAMSAGIQAYPTFHLYENGTRVAEVRGANPKSLEDAIIDCLSKEEKTEEKSPFNNFPLVEDEIVKYDSVKFEMVKEKIEEFNGKVESELRLSVDEFGCVSEIIAVLESRNTYLNSSFTAEQYRVIEKMLKWPSTYVIPVLNLPRMILFHPSAAKYISERPEFIHSLVELFQRSDMELIGQLLLLQTFCNLFCKRVLFDTVTQCSEDILNATASCIGSKSKKVVTTFVSLLVNFAILFRIAPHSQTQNAKIHCLSSVIEVLKTSQISPYKPLVVLGTLVYGDEEIQLIASTMDVSSVISKYSEDSVQNVSEAAREIVKCIVEN